MRFTTQEQKLIDRLEAIAANNKLPFKVRSMAGSAAWSARRRSYKTVQEFIKVYNQYKLVK